MSQTASNPPEGWTQEDWDMFQAYLPQAGAEIGAQGQVKEITVIGPTAREDQGTETQNNSPKAP